MHTTHSMGKKKISEISSGKTTTVTQFTPIIGLQISRMWVATNTLTTQDTEVQPATTKVGTLLTLTSQDIKITNKLTTIMAGTSTKIMDMEATTTIMEALLLPSLTILIPTVMMLYTKELLPKTKLMKQIQNNHQLAIPLQSLLLWCLSFAQLLLFRSSCIREREKWILTLLMKNKTKLLLSIITLRLLFETKPSKNPKFKFK